MVQRGAGSDRKQRTSPAMGLLGGALLSLLIAASAHADRHILRTRQPSGDTPQSITQKKPVLGSALTILSDGTAPWEDRPLTIPGFGTIPGTVRSADPGDDTGPSDRVVRSWDVVTYRLALSIRDATAEDIVAEVMLTGPVTWDERQLVSLELSNCPGGATIHDGGKRLRCIIGRLEAPPAVTIAIDLIARVRGSALQGEVITAAATVRAPDVVPDRDPARCPGPQVDGCDATAPDVSTSAAPAAELRKYFVKVAPSIVDGVPGRAMTWRLDAVLGADGDIRGTSHPVGAPWRLPDWWIATGRSGRDIDLPVRLIECTDLDESAEWRCAQPGGDGTPLEMVIERVDLSAVMSDRAATTLPKVVGSLEVELWVPEEKLLKNQWDVPFTNCFGTVIGNPSESLWAPTDAQGQPNLNGMPEPPENNCATVVLPVPRPAPPGGGGGGGSRPRPPGPRDPGRPSPPVATPTPVAVLDKRYTPIGFGDGVAEGMEFAAEVSIRVLSDEALPNVIACDKWDNRTHTLRDGGVSGVSVWWQNEDGELEPMDPDNVVVEFARGLWGRQVPDHISVGERWFTQATSGCADSTAISPPGWATADRVDFLNDGGLTIDARDVNMVRARYVDPVLPGVEVWMEVMLRAERNPSGTWLINYAAGAWGARSRAWQAKECFGAGGSGAHRACPKPAPGSRWRPGLLGDKLVQVGVPVWLKKKNDPPAPDGSPIILAGERAAFTLQASTFPKPDDPPPPDYPPGASAIGVMLTDTLPAGMTYELGSSILSSEDMNQNGVLEPDEDLNGNGRIDTDVPFEPKVDTPPFFGPSTLQWRLGDLPFETESAVIRYEARASRLIRSGTALTNWAAVAAKGESPRVCGQPVGDIGIPLLDSRTSWNRQNGAALQNDSVSALQPGHELVVSGLCAWAQVIVSNSAAAQVEKVPRKAIVAPGEDMVFQLGLANLASRPAEWFDAVDLLPQAGEPRTPGSRIGGGLEEVDARFDGFWPPIEIWASATDPGELDIAGGGVRDGLVDPVTAWGGGSIGGVGLGGLEWPCLLDDVRARRCSRIREISAITALRFWGPDPQPKKSGTAIESFLPIDGRPRFINVTLHVPGSQPGDIAHNEWGGRFEGLPLPVFDGAIIRVPPLATQTPTASSVPTSTATSTSTRFPTSTATATIVSTPTSVSIRRIYLPTTLRHPCVPRPIDAVLVIDISSSMLRSAGDGGSKLDAVMRASRAFVDRFDPERSGGRIAIAMFNKRAWVTQPLTNDPGRLNTAIDDLPRHIEEGTRLDLGLRVGAEAVGAAEAGRWRAMVFLTDGLPNRVPTPESGGRQEDTVLVAAFKVRDGGIEVYTVGYGRVDAPDIADRISPDLLRDIAGDSSRYHETDDAGALADVFREIAGAIGCGEDTGWP